MKSWSFARRTVATGFLSSKEIVRVIRNKEEAWRPFFKWGHLPSGPRVPNTEEKNFSISFSWDSNPRLRTPCYSSTKSGALYHYATESLTHGSMLARPNIKSVPIANVTVLTSSTQPVFDRYWNDKMGATYQMQY